MSGSSPACPICNTALQRPVGLAPGAEAHIKCSLCATEAVIAPDGTVMTEVEWQRRPNAEAAAAHVPQAPAATAPQPTPQTSPTPAAAPTSDPWNAAHADEVLKQATTPSPSPLDARAFEGSLKNLSVVDVLQLLYSSQKTGVLTLTHGVTTASITLEKGLIIGCEHPTRGTQIGRLLVKAGAVTQVDLQAALAQQQQAGANRQRIVATLVAMGKVDRLVGWKVLERLVEDTVLTTLGWQEGTFVFEVGTVDSSDDFKHLATGVTDKPGVDVQSTLLEALRVLDEGGRKPAAEETTIDDSFEFDIVKSPDADTTTDATGASIDLTPAPMAPVDAASKSSPPWAVLVNKLKTPSGRRVGIAGAAVALLLLVVVVWLASGSEDESTVTGGSASGAAPVAATDTPTDPIVDTPPEPEPLPIPAPEPIVTTTKEPENPVKPTKRRRKRRKRKAKSARSLFDAALE